MGGTFKKRQQRPRGPGLLSDQTMEEELQQCLKLLQCFEDEAGLVLREEVVRELDRMVKEWSREEAARRRVELEEETGARLVSYGSYKLEVIDHQSDLDLLCVVARHLTRNSFFGRFYDSLKAKEEVTELRQLPLTLVPVIKFRYRGVEVDLTMARVTTAATIPETEEFLLSEKVTQGMDPRCLRSLNGYRASCQILELVPNLEVFRQSLRVVKVWARKQGLYSTVLGFLGGASWTLLVVKACQLSAAERGQDSLTFTLHTFFRVFSDWEWPRPVYIKVVESEGSGWDWGHCMPVITPTFPHMNSAVNVSQSNCDLIQAKCREAFRRLQSIRWKAGVWADFFTPNDFFVEFRHYLVISATCQGDSRLWFGAVESKLRHLVSHMMYNHRLETVRIWPQPFMEEGGGTYRQMWIMGVRMNVPVSPKFFQEPVFNFRDLCLADAVRMSLVSAHSFTFQVAGDFLSPGQLRARLARHVMEAVSRPLGHRQPVCTRNISHRERLVFPQCAGQAPA